MAISITSATITTNHSSSSPLLCSLKSPSSSSSSFSSLRFHLPLQLRVATSYRLRPRILPLVKAKKETFSSLDDLLVNSEKPVLVDFYATWCGPCQLMVPILEQASATLKDKIQIVKIDTEKYPKIADKYKIEGLPTFILFKNGEPCDRFEGALPADKLIQRIEGSLAVKS